MTPTNPAALLRALVACSGLPAYRFAAERMGRPKRTVYNWLNGSRPVPPVILDWMALQPEYSQALEALNSQAESVSNG